MENLNSVEEIKSALRSPASKVINKKLSIVTIFREQDSIFVKDFIRQTPNEVELILCKTLVSKNGKRYELKNTLNNIKFYDLYFDQFTFDEARNRAKEFANGEWILSLDIDDRISESQFKKIFQILEEIKNYNVGGIRCGLSAWIPPASDKAEGEWFIKPQIKLFKNANEIKWYGHCHEQVKFSIAESNYNVIDSSILIEHIGYDAADKPIMKHKARRNFNLLVKQCNREMDIEQRKYFERELLKTSVLMQELGLIELD